MPAQHPFGRAERLAHQVQKEIASLLLTGRVHDPAVRDVTVTSVRLSKDLRYADVYVQLGRGSGDSDGAIAGLTRAAGFLRRELRPRLNSRVIPELRFHADKSLDTLERMSRLLAEVSPAPVEEEEQDQQDQQDQDQE